jgi:hypothetical protein
MSDPLRVAILSTPRSGNTWLRLLLAAAYRVPDLAVHKMWDSDWAGLPPECVLQLHWNRTPKMRDRLAEHGFRVVTVARHPLDTLVSIVPFALTDGDTRQWLQGTGGDESGLFGASPRSRAFVRYATGPRAAALFSVTADWWGEPDVTAVRYEDLVADPAGELARVCGRLAPPREPDLAAVAAGHTLDRLRPRAGNGHFWQGRPGHWRELVPAPEAAEIAAALPGAFAKYGYACDPDPALTAEAADANWVRAVGPALRAAMQRSLDAQAAAEAHRKAADAARQQVTEADDRTARATAEAARLRAQVAELEARFVPFAGLRGFEVRVARWLAAVRGGLRVFTSRERK